jgi:hypothetical protein
VPSPRVALPLLCVAAAAIVGESFLPNHRVLEGDLLIYFPSLVHTPWDGPWDEWVGNGAPALGNPQRAMFYPPAWPLRWTFVAWLPFYLWLHHALAAIGAWAWLRRKGPGWGPVIGGALYACAGPAASLVTKLDKLPGLAWAPFVLLGVDAAWRGERWGAALAAVAMGALWCGGSVEHVPMLTLAVTCFALLEPGRRAYRLAVGAGCVALGLALAGPSLVPFLELLPHTARAASERTDPLALALAPADLLRFVGFATDGKEHWISSLYLGGVGLLLAMGGTAWGTRRAPAVALSITALVLALGAHTPIGAAIAHLPIVGDMRYPEKWVLAFLLGFAWLVDGGVRVVERRWSPAPLLAIAMVELVLSFRAHFAWSDPRVAFAASPAIAAIQRSWDGEGIPRLWDPDVHTKSGLPRWPGATLATDLHRIVYPNTGVPFDIGYLFGTSALRMERSVRTVHAILALDDARAIAMLRRLGVDYWVRYDPIVPSDLEPVEAPRLEVGVARDRRSAPPARIASFATIGDWASLVDQLATANLDHTWGLVGDPGVDAVEPRDGRGTATSERIAAGHWRVEADADAPAVVVLTEGWAPGWTAAVDGGPPVAAIPVDAMLVGAPIPAGHHTVELEYVPPGLGLGNRLAILAVLLGATVWVRPSR